MKIIKSISCIIILTFSACDKSNGYSKIYDLQKSFNEENVIDHGHLQLELKYSNIIYDWNGKQFVMPIFRGNKGSIEEETIINYYTKIGNLKPLWPGAKMGIGSFVISCKKGEVRKTLYEFLQFYKGNILKDADIEHPSCINRDHDAWILEYTFDYNATPCFLRFSFADGDKSKGPDYTVYKSLNQIKIDENEEGFLYSFWFGKHCSE